MNPVNRFLQTIDIRLIAVGMSCLFSLIVIAANPIPNDDAFSYLRAAELYPSQGLDATLGNYGWYWYSVLIATINTLLPIGLMNIAHLLNILFYGVLVYAFITLATEYRPGNNVKFFAAVVILFYPTINEMRYFLIRDFAYWAFSLTALVQCIRFKKTGDLVFAFGWLLATCAAILFRLEGLVILIASPFAMLLPDQKRLKQGISQFATLAALVFAGAAATVFIFFLAGINIFEIFNFTFRWYLPLLAEYPETLTNAAENANLSFHISEQVENFTGKGIPVLILGYCYSLLSTLVMTLSPPACLFLAYALFTGKITLSSENKWPWLAFFSSAILVLLIFVSIMQFLTTRYAVLASLLLLSLTPLAIEKLYTRAQQTSSLKIFMTAFRVCVLFFAVDSLASFGYSKTYIQEAIVWTNENISTESTLQTNNFALAYYSGLVPEYDKINTNTLENISSLSQSDFLAVELSHDDSPAREALVQSNQLEELARFANKRDDAIIIYRINSLPR